MFDTPTGARVPLAEIARVEIARVEIARCRLHAGGDPGSRPRATVQARPGITSWTRSPARCD